MNERDDIFTFSKKTSTEKTFIFKNKEKKLCLGGSSYPNRSEYGLRSLNFESMYNNWKKRYTRSIKLHKNIEMFNTEEKRKDWFRKQFRSEYTRFKSFRDTFKIYRGICSSLPLPKIAELLRRKKYLFKSEKMEKRFNGLGLCWAYKEDSATTGYTGCSLNNSIRLYGIIDKENVNWKKTIILNTDINGYTENEIRLKKGVEVFISKVSNFRDEKTFPINKILKTTSK